MSKLSSAPDLGFKGWGHPLHGPSALRVALPVLTKKNEQINYIFECHLDSVNCHTSLAAAFISLGGDQ